jgi:hypothetical protein
MNVGFLIAIQAEKNRLHENIQPVTNRQNERESYIAVGAGLEPAKGS